MRFSINFDISIMEIDHDVKYLLFATVQLGYSTTNGVRDKSEVIS